MQQPDTPGAAQPARRIGVSIVLAGSGGAGVMTAGNMLLEAAAHAGYYALMTRSSGPQIRGGEAAALLRIATRPVDCMEDRFDVLAAVDWENVERFNAEIPLDAASLIVGDPDQGDPPQVFIRSGAAAEMADEEREHVRLIQQWLARVGPPEAGWDEDPDPPAGVD